MHFSLGGLHKLHSSCSHSLLKNRPTLRWQTQLKARQHIRRGCRPCQAFFNFGIKKEKPATSIAEKREFYSDVDVEHYFNYMGMLAEEGTYDKLNRLQSTGLEPVDLLLVMAAAENDAPKVGELLRAGANTAVKGPEGKSPLELATSEEVLELLKDPSKAAEMDFA